MLLPALPLAAGVRATARPDAADADRRARRACGRCPWPGSMPAFDLQSARPLGVFARDHPDSLAEGPDMPLWIACPIRAVAIELVGRLLQDHRARCLGPGAMRLDPIPK